MITLHDLFDVQEFFNDARDKYINVRDHPDDPFLLIANYSATAQFEQRWNAVTMQCRGLIYRADTLEVVARSFPKFFNWDDTRQAYPPGGQCFVMPKMDGSMGVLYPNPDKTSGWAVATRGSFSSTQAIKATKFWHNVWHDDELPTPVPNPDKTYLFEIIYPENRIVVNYGKAKRLVLLDVIDTDTGKSDIAEFHAFEWPDKVERKLLDSFTDALIHEIPKGEEGFVIHWPYQNVRIKMKSAEYLELHKTIFGLTERTVWNHIRHNGTVAALCAPLPDEFHQWVVNVADRMKRAVQAKMLEVVKAHDTIVRSLPEDYDRRELIKLVDKHPLKGYLLLHIDGQWQEMLDSAWTEVRPSGAIPAFSTSEDTA